MKPKKIVLTLSAFVMFVFAALSLPAEIQWEKKADAAQYGGADWKNKIRQVSNISLETATNIAEKDPSIDFFFYIKKGPLTLGSKGVFKKGDAVFFSGTPWIGSAPGYADIYIKSGGSSSEKPVDNGIYGKTVHLNDGAFYDRVRGKLVFVDFYADWCGPCVAFAPTFEEAAGIHTNNMFIKMDVDVNSTVPSQFGVEFIPYVAAVYNGQEIDRFAGQRDIETFSSWCAGFIESYGEK